MFIWVYGKDGNSSVALSCNMGIFSMEQFLEGFHLLYSSNVSWMYALDIARLLSIDCNSLLCSSGSQNIPWKYPQIILILFRLPMYSRISNQMLIIVPMVKEMHLSKTFPPSCLPFAGMGYHGHIKKHKTGCTGRPIQYIHTWQRYWSSPQTSERTNPQVF